MSQNYEQMRSKIAKQYKDRINTLESENKELKKKVVALEDELNSVKSELESKNDWIERMQDFCNMSDADRQKYLENEANKNEITQSLQILTSGLSKSGFLTDLMRML